MNDTHQRANTHMLSERLDAVCAKVAPLWPLENFVAVNPFLGNVHQRFDELAHRLNLLTGASLTMPSSFYREKIQNGTILKEDIETALSRKPYLNLDVETCLRQIGKSVDLDNANARVSSLLDVAAQLTEMDWNRFSISRISAWAASYFDKHQAVWSKPADSESIYQAWKSDAGIDLSAEINGLRGFRKAVRCLPDKHLEAANYALDMLEVDDELLETYLERILYRVRGWSSYCAYLDWNGRLYGGKTDALKQFLCVLLSWEACVLECLDRPELRVLWSFAKEELHTIQSEEIDRNFAVKLTLQKAFELSKQRTLISTFTGSDLPVPSQTPRPLAQAVFCIDVRSEVIRRKLEQADNRIETFGFAGFFGFPINYVPIAHQHGEAQCPALIKSGPTVHEVIPDANLHQKVVARRIFRNQIRQVWKTFKTGAVSCFSFVSPLGLFYLPKLFSDSFGLSRPVPHAEKVGIKPDEFKRKSVGLEPDVFDSGIVGIPYPERIQMAKSALKAISLTENVAPFVLIVGHGSSSVNNPHASGLDCGACGGHSGEANAKVAAAVLNDKVVRKALSNEGIHIPTDTVFLACLHNTTTDEFSLYNECDVPYGQVDLLNEVKEALLQSGKSTREERAKRMNIHFNVEKAVPARSNDWSQVRPELGLAGCHYFIVAPRARTKELNLEGAAFLHSYNWKKDEGFGVLETIMTAPMIVTSWINLQYYASTVDNKAFGSGNKTLHNVTSGIGVLEGYSGDLRVGLPMQSIHDGNSYLHEPVKLHVVIEAPSEEMNAVLQKHQMVKNLCDNGWIHLFSMSNSGRISHRYDGNLRWTVI